MRRFTIILCFISRVIYGTYTVQHHSYSEHISRKSRSNMPNVPQSYIYRHFPKAGEFSGSTQRDVMPYVPQESKSVEKLRKKPPPIYENVITPYATPSSLKSDIDYEIAKAESNARYESSRMISDNVLDKLKSVMHYHPIPPNEITAGYDGSSEYHMDDDDVRSSSRSLYDNWPYFYHSPYEYEHNKDIFDAEKAKDKRYVSDEVKSIIPVHEVIENDGPGDKDISYYDITDNPITGDQPFFSFVLNDYFERNGYDEDPLTFKGLDWGRDFDREILIPEIDNDRNRRLENSNYYSTTISPLTTTTQDIYSRYLNTESAANTGRQRQHEFNKRENGAKKHSDHNTEYDNKSNQYNGFKDFLDTFANKFGSEDHKRDSNIIHKINRDKGENRKGFHRVYHKDEYQEDKEFFDNNNSSTRGVEKGSANTHVGGSEAYLRSQAAAEVGNQSKTASNSGKTRDKKFEKTHTGHDKSNTLENSFNTFIDVAKQAALSNEADYADHYRI